MENRIISRRDFMKIAGAGAAALAISDKLLVTRAFGGGEEAGNMQNEEVGYTFCDGCNQIPFCGIKFFRRGNVVTRVEPWQGYPHTPICSKGYATLQRLYNPNRLKYPMKRTSPKGSANPGFLRISWDEAYDTIVGHLKRIKEQYGPHSVFFYGGDPKEPRAVIQRLAATYGSVNSGDSTTCHVAGILAAFATYGFPTMGELPSSETKVSLIWGMNHAYTSEPAMQRHLLEAKEQGVKFIVVDPRNTPTAATLADIHLKPRPATTAALAAGILHVIFKENLHDKEFCKDWIYGIDELKGYVKEFPPEKVEEITWVPAKKVVDAARLYAAQRPGGLMVSSQSTSHDLNAFNNNRSIFMIPAVCGYIDIPGGVTKHTNHLEGFINWATAGSPKFSMMRKMREMTPHRLDLKAFPVWAEKSFHVHVIPLVEWAKEGKVKALLGWGLNTMCWPQTSEYQKAIESLEFSMTVDYFYRPWTHDYVDLLLPAAMNYERLAPFSVMDRSLYGRRPVKPLGECKEDWQIALDIGVRLGHADLFFNGNVEAACDDILKMWGLSYNDLRKNQEKGVHVPARGPEVYKKYETGGMRRDKKPGFDTPSGKLEAVSLTLKKHGYPALPVFKEPIPTTKEYPLVLISGARVPYITHSKWREDAPWLLELQKGPLLQINPKDAAKRKLKFGDEVILKSAYGKIKVKAKPTIIVPQGVVTVMHGWPKANVNELIPRKFDPISGFPAFKEITCEVAKV